MAAPPRTEISRLPPGGEGREGGCLVALQRGDERVVVRMVRRRRKTMGLYVGKGDPTELRVPERCAWRHIRDFLESRFNWIVQSEREVARMRTPPENRYEPEGDVRFLGDMLTLTLHKSRWCVVEREGDRLHVSCPQPDRPQAVQRHVERWYRSEAAGRFRERIGEINGRFRDGCPAGEPTIRKMKARWGSCSATGEICLNLNLIREPLPLVDLVVAHELCHLRHFAHDQAFYRLLSAVMPDWRQRDEMLGGLT